MTADFAPAKAAAIFARDARVAVSYNAVSGFAGSTSSSRCSSSRSFRRSFTRRPVSVTTVEQFLISLTSRSTWPSCASNRPALLSFAEAIRDGQISGTFKAILATPTSLSTIVLSAGLWGFTLTSAQTLVFLTVAALLGLDLSSLNTGLALFFVVLTIAAVSPLGVLASALTMTFKKTGPIEVFMQSTAVLLGGVYLPVDRLPPVLQTLSWCLPITHALRGLRAAFQGASATYVAGDAVWLATAAALLLPISLFVFHMPCGAQRSTARSHH